MGTRNSEIPRVPGGASGEVDRGAAQLGRSVPDELGRDRQPGQGNEQVLPRLVGVQDDLEARLVVLTAEHPYGKEAGSPAEVAAKAILASRGSAPRLFQNTLVFLAADRVRLEDLDEALRKYLAWKSILAEKGFVDVSCEFCNRNYVFSPVEARAVFAPRSAY